MRIDLQSCVLTSAVSTKSLGSFLSHKVLHARLSPVTDGLTAANAKYCLLAYLLLCVYPKPQYYN
jgi:hypothetical protein